MLRPFLRLLPALALAAGLLTPPAHAQNAPAAPQTPAQFLGYPLGSRFTYHADVLRYADYLARQFPDRLRVQPYGKTYEGRPLEVVQLASARNLTRLDDIRHSNLRRTGLETGAPEADQPAVVWLSYNVHGNEAVSSEAVLQVLYDFANPQNAEAQALLEKVVLLIDPCVNPDGHERYVQWYGRVAGAPTNASALSWEHREPWPGGRFNHYLFDLNRDWAWQTQAESRQRVALYNQWLPQVHADFHEMGPDAPYYFSPAAKPFHEDITAYQRQFQNRIGDYNRQTFDKNGWLYFTRETYDLFAPSYGDTWPSFNGAIGMTYEQGGSGRAGVRYVKADGDTLTLTQRIAHHHAASWATIRAAADHQAELLREFGKYYADARQQPHGRYKTFVVSGPAERMAPLTDYLRQQQIQFGYAGEKRKLRAYNYASGKEEAVELKNEDVVISMYQPKSTLVKVLFEPQSALEDSLTYDITAWSLPYAYGLQGYAVTSKLSGKESSGVSKQKAGSTVPTTINPQLAPALPPTINTQQSAPNSQTPYAYIARWNSLRDARLLAALLQRQIRVRVAYQPFEAGGRKFQPGALILTRGTNEALGRRFDAVVRQLADSVGAELTAVQTGFATSGSDLGSSNVHGVGRPSVAVLAGAGVDPTAFGEVWHFFEQQLGYPITVLGSDYFGSVPLTKFDVLILPDGNYADALPERQLENLKTWVRAGGRLIALEGAMSYLAGKKDFALKAKADTARSRKPEAPRPLRRYAAAERESLQDLVQGSVYPVQLDNSHPLAFGYGDTYYALVRNPLNYQYLGEGSWNVGVLRKGQAAAGFTGSQARRKLGDTVVLGVQEMGRGQVVYLGDNPLFRGFWHAGKLLFSNAVFFVGQ